MTAALRPLAAAAAAALLAACLADSPACRDVDCSGCVVVQPGVWLFVTDAGSGGPVPGVVVPGFTCALQAGLGTACHATFGAGLIVYDVAVTAPGYAPRTVHVDESALSPASTSGCCPGCPLVVTISVGLVRL